MILYFSGTGNSQYVALELAKMIADDEVISINQSLKAGERITIQSKRPLVFVAPTYSWRLPKVVGQWMMETVFQGNQDVYFILTCGGNCGNAAAYAKKLCDKKKLQFRGLASVVMPENYLALFPIPDESECRTIIEHANLSIAVLAKQIQSNQDLMKPDVSFGERLESGPVNFLFYALFAHDKGFWVTDRCVACGKCAKRCPLNNIKLANGSPVWQGNCTHCMACIGGCPTEAIEYKKKSKERRRYYIMEDTLCWGNEGEEI